MLRERATGLDPATSSSGSSFSSHRLRSPPPPSLGVYWETHPACSPNECRILVNLAPMGTVVRAHGRFSSGVLLGRRCYIRVCSGLMCIPPRQLRRETANSWWNFWPRVGRHGQVAAGDGKRRFREAIVPPLFRVLRDPHSPLDVWTGAVRSAGCLGPTLLDSRLGVADCRTRLENGFRGYTRSSHTTRAPGRRPPVRDSFSSNAFYPSIAPP